MTISKWIVGLCCVGAVHVISVVFAETTFIPARAAVFRALDRVSGQITDRTIAVGDSVRYGTLDIVLSDCRYLQADANSEAYGYFTIRDFVRNQDLFQGWMVMSSPGLNALDHPRYDIWLLHCITASPTESAG